MAEQEQYNFTDPQSRIMKNSRNGGFEQHYNAQLAVNQAIRLIVAHSLSAHANDQLDALPTVDAIAPRLGKPKRVALDSGYLSDANMTGLEARLSRVNYLVLFKASIFSSFSLQNWDSN